MVIAFADPGIRNVTAQLQLLITVTMMSRISIHLKKQHGKGYDPDITDDVETDKQHIPPMPSMPLMTTGFIENTRNLNTGANNTSGRRLQGSDNELNLRPSNGASTLTAASTEKAGVTVRDDEGASVDPSAINRFEEMGKMESGTYKSES